MNVESKIPAKLITGDALHTRPEEVHRALMSALGSFDLVASDVTLNTDPPQRIAESAEVLLHDKYLSDEDFKTIAEKLGKHPKTGLRLRNLLVRHYKEGGWLPGLIHIDTDTKTRAGGEYVSAYYLRKYAQAIVSHSPREMGVGMKALLTQMAASEELNVELVTE